MRAAALDPSSDVEHLDAQRVTAVLVDRAPPSPVIRAVASAALPTGWAKAVVFTTRHVVVTAGLAARLAALDAAWTSPSSGWPALADLPAVGTEIDAGRPALTVFTNGRHPGAALTLLRTRVATVRAALDADRLSPRDAAGEPPTPRPRDGTA